MFADPLRQGQLVVDALAETDADVGCADAMSVFAAWAAAVIAGGLDIGVAWLTSDAVSLRAEGRRRYLARALAVQAWAAVHRAELDVADAASTQAIGLARETGQPPFVAIGLSSGLMLAAVRGGDLLARQGRWARARADSRAVRAGGYPGRWAVARLAEAAARTGHQDEALSLTLSGTLVFG